MKTFALRFWIGATALCGLLALTGFDRPGAHSMLIYLDKELVAEKYVTTRMDVPVVQIAAGRNQQLVVRYSECGRTVSGRKLTLRDDQNKILKTWSYEGSTEGFKDAMTCEIRDIMTVAGGRSSTRLWYSSNDFPDGVHILTLNTGTSLSSAGS